MEVDMKLHRFKIDLTCDGMGSRVQMDGREVYGLVDIQIRAGVKERTKVYLTLLADSVEGEIEFAPDFEQRGFT
jgi:hypothetical protein